MANEVKFFHPAMNGAPSLTGQAGALVALLDACLVNGFGLGALDSLVIASNVATATRAAGHSQEVGSIVEIAGATVSGGTINGQHKVLSATVTAFTFATTGLADQTATGSPTAKLAAAGWTKAFSGTNLGAYQSSDVGATGVVLRVDDTQATYSRVIGYETMSDIDTGTGPFPTAAQLSGGGHWTKSNAASVATRPWALVADGLTFYLAINHNNASPDRRSTVGFGDFLSFNSGGDAYGAFLQAHGADIAGYTPGTFSSDIDFSQTETPTVSQNLFFTRSYSGLGGSVQGLKAMPFPFTYSGNGVRSGVGGWQYPNGPDGGLYVAYPYLVEASALAIRGRLPGVLVSPQTIPGIASDDEVTGVSGLTGRTLHAIRSDGVFFFDKTGPWR